MRLLKAVDAPIEGLTFSPDGSAIAASIKHQGVYLWDLQKPNSEPSRPPLEFGGIDRRGGLSFSADGRSLAWHVQGVRRIYDLDTRKTTTETTFATNKNNIKDIAYAADGSMGISLHGIPDYRLLGWRFVEDMWVTSWSLSTQDLAVDSLSLSSDGQLFAMLTRHALGKGWERNPRQVEVRDASSKALRGAGQYKYSVEAKRLLFAPDNRQLVGLNGMNLVVWPVPEIGDLGTPRLVRNVTRKSFTSMAYHPSGRRLYVTSNAGKPSDATVHVFDTSSWNRTEQFAWKMGNLKAVAVTPDGTLAAAGSDHGEIVIWDVDL